MTLSSPIPQPPRRTTILTGQVGMDKKPYLADAAQHAQTLASRILPFHVGDLMYAEAPDIPPGKILDLPLSRLNTLRRAAFKDIIAAVAAADPSSHPVINTHATFRWRHGLFPAFDFDQIHTLAPSLFICLVDNVEMVHHRLHAEHHIDATLKDCMVWREEEILATEILARSVPGSRFYILSRGRHAPTHDTLARLITSPTARTVYPSFPMSHVVDMPDVLEEIDTFRKALAKHFITFDPGDVDEKLLLERAIAAAREGHIDSTLDVTPHLFGGPSLPPSQSSGTGVPPVSSPSPSSGGTALQSGDSSSSSPIQVRVREVLDIAGDIDGQIYMRDFKLIDQSDMIVSLIPQLPGGIPALSSGVERELQHAFEHGKEVYVIWKPTKNPSPFITETSTKIFPTVDAALQHFESAGMFTNQTLFSQ